MAQSEKRRCCRIALPHKLIFVNFFRTEHSTDSGAASGDHSPCPLRGGVDQTPTEPNSQQQQQQLSSAESSPGEGEKIHYKIGDLGHVASIFGGEVDPEEGDCRYMAPEFLEMEVSRG